MGFWNELGKAALGAGKSIAEDTQKAKDLAYTWQDKDKAFIHDKFKNGSKIERMAARKVAIDNGWIKSGN